MIVEEPGVEETIIVAVETAETDDSVLVETELNDCELLAEEMVETSEVVTELPEELTRLNQNWDELSDETRAAILMLVEADRLTQS